MRRSTRQTRAVLTGKSEVPSNKSKAKGVQETQGTSNKIEQPNGKVTFKPISVLYEDLRHLKAQESEVNAELDAATGAVAAAEQALQQAKSAFDANKSSKNRKEMKAAQMYLTRAKKDSKDVTRRAGNLESQITKLNRIIAERKASGEHADIPTLGDDSDLTDLDDDISQNETDPSHASAVDKSSLKTAGKGGGRMQQDATAQDSSTSSVNASSGLEQEPPASATDAVSVPETSPTPETIMPPGSPSVIPSPVPESTESPPKTLTAVVTQQNPESSDDNPVPQTDPPAFLSSTTTSLPNKVPDPASLFTPEPSPEPSQPSLEGLPQDPATSPTPNIAQSKASLSSGEDELEPESGMDTLRPPKWSKTRKHHIIDSDGEDQAAPQSADSKKAKAAKAPPKQTRSHKRKAAEDNSEETTAPNKRAKRTKGQGEEEDNDELVVLNDDELPVKRRRRRDADKRLLPPPDLTETSRSNKIKKIRAWLSRAINGVGPSAIEDVSKSLGIRTLLYESASILPELVTTAREITLAAIVSAEGNLICRYHTISDKSMDKPGAVDGDDNTLHGRPWPWIHAPEKRLALDAQVKAKAAAAAMEDLPADPELLTKHHKTPGWKIVESRATPVEDRKAHFTYFSLVDDWRADFLTPRQRALVCAQYREGSLLDVDDLYSMGVENGRWVKRDKLHHRRVQAERALKIIEAEGEKEKVEEMKGDAEITAAMHS
ncbi:hypothetical protein VNI00_003814 [Paramarasmius palmivorus]|uniref:Uncharacterized protein n=1 Tax=Paramarasmius palmivorus TaxID=297713 RepID=A0AAW0DN72_9AGAR